MPLIQVNPLNSNESLKMQKQLISANTDEPETPIVKSLFEIKGNSKFRNPQNKEGGESSSEEEKPKATALFFTSAKDQETKHAWPNPFAKKTGVSPVFTTGKSLW